MPWHRGGSFEFALVRRALVFGLPLLPHALSHWALQLADRGVIASLVNARSLGIYSLAANILLPFLLVMSLNQSLMPIYARVGAATLRAGELRDIVVFQVTGVAGLTLAGALLGGPVVDILAPPSYAGADSLVPWLVLGYGFVGLYFIPMNGATLGAGRTKHVWVPTAIAACCNIGLLFVLVPPFGIKAGAVASARWILDPADRDVDLGSYASESRRVRLEAHRNRPRSCRLPLRRRDRDDTRGPLGSTRSSWIVAAAVSPCALSIWSAAV